MELEWNGNWNESVWLNFKLCLVDGVVGWLVGGGWVAGSINTNVDLSKA